MTSTRFTFVAIAGLGGFTRAGQRLHRKQPPISRRLGLREHELGTPMFEWLRGHVRLTEAGRACLPYAKAALAALRDGEAPRGAASGIEPPAKCKQPVGSDSAGGPRFSTMVDQDVAGNNL
jgi:DNA-binding transcriptional LysR family regulator